MKCKISPLWDDPANLTPDSLDETAARWSELLRDAPDQQARDSFEAWRAQSPENAKAFERVDAAHALALSLADTPQMQALRQETLARMQAASLRRSGRSRAWAIAASLLLAAGLGVFAVGTQTSWRLTPGANDVLADDVYQTGIGQRSVVTLADGSVVTLNTNSRISAHYEAGLRAVTLERGQALFKVAKDPSRPFVVSADGRQVTALGTEFDVNLSRRAFEVTLLEGRVTVTRANASASPKTGVKPALLAELKPGQQFVAVAKTVPQVRAADLKRVVSWRNGQIVFENERLEDAVAEMNRYSRKQIVLSDSELASLKISGAFNTGDTGTFVEALTAYFPIERTKAEEDKIVLKSAPPVRG